MIYIIKQNLITSQLELFKSHLTYALLTKGAFTIDSSTPTLTGNLSVVKNDCHLKFGVNLVSNMNV
jgi:hypothetical protein